jgi:two-component system cell cycle response regulator
MPRRILVIEDNPTNLELMTYLLRAHGFETPTAADGDAGLEAAGREAPDLIVCDVQLPSLDGYEVVRRLKADPGLRAIPVVAVTAFAMVDDRRKALDAGFDGYLTKPIDPETFVGTVEGFLPPSERGAANAAVPAVESPAAPAPVGRMVLVVDDDPVNLELAVSLLRGCGYRTATAMTPADALRIATASPPDLILSDVIMGQEHGFEFIRRVKADPALCAIPFVFVTSTMTDERARREGLALGATRFLFRPIEPQALLHEIEACLGLSGEG